MARIIAGCWPALSSGDLGPVLDRDHDVCRAAVVRSATASWGLSRLYAARLLQRQGGEVTIYAKALPPQTRSNVTAGQWSPYFVSKDRSEARNERLRRTNFIVVADGGGNIMEQWTSGIRS